MRPSENAAKHTDTTGIPPTRLSEGDMLFLGFVLLVIFSLFPAAPVASEEDPYLWLEEIEGEKALQWVKQRSREDTKELEAVAEFETIQKQLLDIFNSRDRIPSPDVRNKWIYNFWQDKDHIRGIWRRTTRSQYITDEPKWETVLDLDALAEAEDENWVWEGATGLAPDHDLFLITLSRGGTDASVRREFDARRKSFVPSGFYLPEAKARVGWRDEDALWIATDFGEESLTSSGYPRIVKLWERGTPLKSARTIFEGAFEDISVRAYSVHTPEGRYDFVQRSIEFYRSEAYLRLGDRLVRLELPDDTELRGVFKNHLLLSLRSDWNVSEKTYPSDALLAIDLDDFLAGGRNFVMLFEPQERITLDALRMTRNHLLVTTLDNVRGRLEKHTLTQDGWTKEKIALPDIGSVGLAGSSDVDDVFFLTYNDFLTPASLYIVEEGGQPKRIKSTPEFFDPEGMRVDQFEAISTDGTRIPYFVILPQGFEKGRIYPTMLYGYGGFETSMKPRYSAIVGSSWVARGGVYVLANIRGGGEFGPEWHQAALKENRQRAFDDFIAVAEDLIARDITSPDHLGIVGGSNGGLLVGACFTQRPDLFNAVVCQVPLLDMKRFNRLLAGASWMGEYGNPDTDDWSFIKEWSPYHNLDESKDYPRVFFYTSTRDDRVHPGHARKMVQKMTEMGKPVYYYENTEGGHSVAANLKQRAYMWALTYAYLWDTLRRSAS
ncbi:MAG: prolyl oligopeptidase family serine peptidase [Verrucomicrobiota bacterium]